MREQKEKEWERLPNEGRKAYAAFCIYKDLGLERSYKKVAEVLHCSIQLVGKWGRDWEWQNRIRAYEENLEREKLKQKVKNRQEMEERHAKVAQLLQAKLVERLQGLSASELSPADVAKWLDVAVKVERLSMGAPTENVTQHHEGEVKVVDDQEQEMLERVLDDPEACRLAAELLERIANSETEPGGVRMAGESEEVEVS